jgi:hypothetical protein
MDTSCDNGLFDNSPLDNNLCDNTTILLTLLDDDTGDNTVICSYGSIKHWGIIQDMLSFANNLERDVNGYINIPLRGMQRHYINCLLLLSDTLIRSMSKTELLELLYTADKLHDERVVDRIFRIEQDRVDAGEPSAIIDSIKELPLDIILNYYGNTVSNICSRAGVRYINYAFE